MAAFSPILKNIHSHSKYKWEASKRLFIFCSKKYEPINVWFNYLIFFSWVSFSFGSIVNLCVWCVMKDFHSANLLIVQLVAIFVWKCPIFGSRVLLVYIKQEVQPSLHPHTNPPNTPINIFIWEIGDIYEWQNKS